MTLSKLLKNVCFSADYIDIVNKYDNEPEETIRLEEDVLDAIHDAVSNSIPYSKNWSLVQYLMKSSKEDGLKDSEKLIKWLEKRIVCFYLKNGHYEIVLYE